MWHVTPASTGMMSGRRAVTRAVRAKRGDTLALMVTVRAPVNDDHIDAAAHTLGPLLGGGDATVDGSGLVERVLTLARLHIGLEVSWFSRFADGLQILDHVDGDGAPFGIAPGVSTPYSASYCSRVISGELPNVVPDIRGDARTRDLPITKATGVGSYAGVPVVLPGGEIYGMLCCIGGDAHPEIDTGDVRFMRVLADVLSEDVQRRLPLERSRAATLARIDAAIAGVGLHMVFQPIVHLSSLEVVGVEALSRFESGPPTPDAWFREAAGVGRGVELEMASLLLAIAAIPELPEDIYLSVNASPDLIGRWAHREVPPEIPLDRLVLEITEHEQIHDYGLLLDALEPVRARGMRVAIDDAGAGYSSFRHILLVKPDVIKLDISITHAIDQDPSRRALATALINFAAEIDATLVAEGVETSAELETLQRLGATLGQGYFFARPAPLPLPRRVSSAGE
jgi:EAL domain-containing protein (putative c-di-GMP-specific phosphodiesterase class I)